MTNKRLAIAFCLAALLFSAAAFAGISQTPDPAQVGKPVTFTYQGNEDVVEWQIQEPQSKAWNACSSSAGTIGTCTFETAGEGKVRVMKDGGMGLEPVEEATVTIE